MGKAKEQSADTRTFAEKVEQYKKMSGRSKRRASLGVDINIWPNESPSFFGENSAWYSKHVSSDLLEGQHLLRSDRWKLLRRAKDYLSRRLVAPESFCLLDPYFQRRHPELRDKSFPLLDYFPGLKYSYSVPLPAHVIARNRGVGLGDGSFKAHYIDVCENLGGSSRRARVSDLMRSRSIRLDPVDAPKHLFVYRLRIRRCISWAYSVGLVPIMMTLTVFHRWHPLKGLLNVLRGAWNYFFTGTRMAVRRAKKMGLVGYIRRAEETINNGSHGSCCEVGLGNFNSGWHPHYHVILFVERDKLDVVSSMEDELREAWFQAVNRYFEIEFGSPIESSYELSFKRHGLFFSRCIGKGFYDTRGCDMSFLDRAIDKSPLRRVDDSEYLAKIFGCDTGSFFGGDSELTGGDVKGSKVPFDLLCDDTAENVDLWAEYALATKGVMSFFFSRGLESRVSEFYKVHPDEDPVKPLDKTRKVLAQVSRRAYRFVYRLFKVDEMLKVAVKGIDDLRRWFRRLYIENGILLSDITEDMLPQEPETRSWYVGVLGKDNLGGCSCVDSLVDGGDVVGVLCDDGQEVKQSDDCDEKCCSDVCVSEDSRHEVSCESCDVESSDDLVDDDVCVPDKGRGTFLSSSLKDELPDSAVARWSLRDYRYGRSVSPISLFVDGDVSVNDVLVRDLDFCPFKESTVLAMEAVLDEIEDVSTDLTMEKVRELYQSARKPSVEGDDP